MIPRSSRSSLRRFLLARELPCLFALALSAAVITATAPTDTLNPMSRPLHPLAVLFFAVAALWVAVLWLYLVLLLQHPFQSLPGHQVRPQEEEHHQHHHQQDHQALQTARSRL